MPYRSCPWEETEFNFSASEITLPERKESLTQPHNKVSTTPNLTAVGAIHNREIPVLAFTDTLPVPRYNHKGLIELLLDLLRSLLLVGLLRLLLVPVFSNDPF